MPELKTRSLSADEIANVNPFNYESVHVLQNAINFDTGRRSSSQPEAKNKKKINGKAKLER